MAQIANGQQGLTGASFRCADCRDTGFVISSCGRECGSHATPCPCQDKQSFGACDRAAIRIEILAGLPIAMAAAAFLYFFH